MTDKPDQSIATLTVQVRKLAAQVTRLYEQSPPSPSAPTWFIEDAVKYEAQLGQLQEWVRDVLRPEYGAYCMWLRDCWPDHREALWELGTLRAVWLLAYDREHPSLVEAINWHDRLLPGVAARLETKVFADCAGMSGCKLRRVTRTFR